MADYLTRIGIETFLALDEASLKQVQDRIARAFSGEGGTKAFSGALKGIDAQLAAIAEAVNKLSRIDPFSKIAAEAGKASAALSGLERASARAFSGEGQRRARQASVDFRDLARQTRLTTFQTTLLTKAVAAQIQAFREGSDEWRGTALTIASLASRFKLTEQQMTPLAAAAVKWASAQETGVIATRKATDADRQRLTVLKELRALEAQGFSHLGRVATGVEADRITAAKAVAAINEVRDAERQAAQYTRQRAQAEGEAGQATRKSSTETAKLAREAERAAAAFTGILQIVDRLAASLKVVDVAKVVKGGGLARVREEAQAVGTAIDATIRRISEFTALGDKQFRQIVQPFQEVQERADAVITRIQRLEQLLQRATGTHHELPISQALAASRKELDGVIASLAGLRGRFDETFRVRTVAGLRQELSKLNLSLRDLRNITTHTEAERQIGIVEALMRRQREMFEQGGIGAAELDKRMALLSGRMEALQVLSRNLERGFRAILAEAPSPERLLNITHARKLQADLEAAAEAANRPSATSTLDPDRLLGIAKATKSAAESARVLSEAFRRLQGNAALDPRQLLGFASATQQINERTSLLLANARSLQGILVQPFLEARPAVQALDQNFETLVARLRQIDLATQVRGAGISGGFGAQLIEAGRALDDIVAQLARFRQGLSGGIQPLARDFEAITAAARVATQRVTALRAAAAKDPGSERLARALAFAEERFAKVQVRAAELSRELAFAGKEQGLARINQQLSELEKTSDRLKGRATFVELTSRAASLRQQISILTRSWEELGFSAESADSRIKLLRRELEFVEKAAVAAGDPREKLGRLHGFLGQLGEDFRGLLAHQVRFYSGMALIFGTAHQITDAFRDMFKFEDAFRRVGIIAGFDAEQAGHFREQLAATKDELRELARTSPVEGGAALAENFLEIVKAGSTLQDAMVTLRGAVQLSVVAGGGLENAINAIVTIQKAWGISTDDLRNKIETLNVALNLSRLDADDLATIFNFVASSAAQAGLRFEDVALAMAVLRNAGVKASQTGTGLSNLFIRLRNGSPKLTAALTEVGIALDDIKPGITEKGFTPLIETFRRLSATGKDTQAVFDALFEGLSLRAGRAAAAFLSQITKGGDEVERLNDLIHAANDGTLEFANTLEGQYQRAILSAQQQLAILRNNFQDLFKGVLESDGSIATLLGLINRLINGLRHLQEAFGFVNRLTGGALGIAVFATIIARVASALGRMTGITTALKNSFEALRIGIFLLMSRAGLTGLINLFAKLRAILLFVPSLITGAAAAIAAWTGAPFIAVLIGIVAAIGAVVTGLAKLLGFDDKIAAFFSRIINPTEASASAFGTLAEEIDRAREAAEKFGATDIRSLRAQVEVGQELRSRFAESAGFNLSDLRTLRRDINEFQVAQNRPLEASHPIIARVLERFGVDTQRTSIYEASARFAQGTAKNEELRASIDRLVAREEALQERLERLAGPGGSRSEAKIAETQLAAVQRDLADLRATEDELQRARNLARQNVDDRQFFQEALRALNTRIEAVEAPSGLATTELEHTLAVTLSGVNNALEKGLKEFAAPLQERVAFEASQNEELIGKLDALAFTRSQRAIELKSEDIATKDLVAQQTVIALRPVIARLEGEVAKADRGRKEVEAANLRFELDIAKATSEAADALHEEIKARGTAQGLGTITTTEITDALRRAVEKAEADRDVALSKANINQLTLAKQAADQTVKRLGNELAEQLRDNPQATREERQATLDKIGAAIDQRVVAESNLARAQRTAAGQRGFIAGDIAAIAQAATAEKLDQAAKAFPRLVRLQQQLNEATLASADSANILAEAEKNAAIDGVSLARLRREADKDALKQAELAYEAAIRLGEQDPKILEALRNRVAVTRQLVEIDRQEQRLAKAKQDLAVSEDALAEARKRGITDIRTLAALEEERLRLKLKEAGIELKLLQLRGQGDTAEARQLSQEIVGLTDQLKGSGKEIRDWEVQFRTSMTNAADTARTAAEASRDAWREIFFKVFTNDFRDLDQVVQNFANTVARSFSDQAADQFSESLRRAFTKSGSSSASGTTAGGGPGFFSSIGNWFRGLFGGGGGAQTTNVTPQTGTIPGWNAPFDTTSNQQIPGWNTTFSNLQTPAQAQATREAGTAIGNAAGSTMVDKLTSTNNPLASWGAGAAGQFGGQFATRGLTANNFPAWQQAGGALGATIGSIWGPVGAGVGGFVGTVGGEGVGRLAAEFQPGNANVMKQEDWARLLGLTPLLTGFNATKELFSGDFKASIKDALRTGLELGLSSTGFGAGPIGLALFGSKQDSARIEGVIRPGIRKLGDTILLEIESEFTRLSEIPGDAKQAIKDSLQSVIEKSLAPIIDFANQLPANLRGRIETAISGASFEFKSKGGEGDVKKAGERAIQQLLFDTVDFYLGSGFDAITKTIDEYLPRNAQTALGLTGFFESFKDQVAAIGDVSSRKDAPEALSKLNEFLQSFFDSLNGVIDTVEQRTADLTSTIKDFGRTGTDLIADLNKELSGLFADIPGKLGLSKDLLQANVDAYRAEFELATGADIIPAGDRLKGAIRDLFQFTGAQGSTGPTVSTLIGNALSQFTAGNVGSLEGTLTSLADALNDPQGLTAAGRLTSEALDLLSGGLLNSESPAFLDLLRSLSDIKDSVGGITGAEAQQLVDDFAADFIDITGKQVEAAEEQQDIAYQQLTELGKIREAVEAIAKHQIQGEIPSPEDIGVPPDAGTGGGGGGETQNALPTALSATPDAKRVLSFLAQYAADQGFAGAGDANDAIARFALLRHASLEFLHSIPGTSTDRVTLFDDGQGHKLTASSVAEAILTRLMYGGGDPYDFDYLSNRVSQIFQPDVVNLTQDEYRKYIDAVAALPLFFRGINYVPRDNYPALLHRGEAVLTAAQAQQARAGDTAIEINIGAPTVNIEGSGEAADELIRQGLRSATISMTSELTRTLTSLGFVRSN